MNQVYVDSILAKRGSKFVQLVKHIDEVPANKLSFPATVQVKYDGVYCAMIVRYGIATAYSRTGNRFTNLDVLEGKFRNMPDGVYIGEVVNPSLSLEELSGAVNCNRVKPLDAKTAGRINISIFVMHDVLTTYEFELGRSRLKYGERYGYVKHYVSIAESPYIMAALSRPCFSIEEFEEFAQIWIEKGHEGAVLKMEADWEAGHKGWRTVKRVRGVHVDLRCIDVHYGKGKREGMIAALEFEYKGKRFKADLGKGWTDEKRLELTFAFENQTSYTPIGKIFHVKGLQESSKGVIRLPKVQEMRIDKTHSD